MAIEIERLIATLEAKMDKFEKALAKQAGGADRQFKRIEDRGKKMERTLAGLGVAGFKGIAAGALSSLGPLLSVAAAVQGAKNALAEFGDIADNAKASGLDAEFFQGLAYQAQLGGVAFDQLSGALATFSKNSGLAVVGKGRMISSLKELNPVLLQSIRAATSQEERIKLVADALSKEADASTRAAIATAAFGDAGAKLADIFSGGAAQIDAMQRKAQDLGLVVANDLIARADELGDEFDTTTKIVDLQLKKALVNLGPILVWLSGLAGDLGDNLGGLFEKTKETADRSLESLTDQLEELRTIQDKAANGGAISKMWAESTDVSGRMRELEREVFRRGEAGSIQQLATVNANPPVSADIPSLDEVASRERAASSAIKQADAVKKLTADLALERESLFLTAEQQAALNVVNSAGIDVNSRQGQELVALVLANERLKNAMAEVEDLAQSAVSSFVDDLRQGKSAADALANSLQGIANKLLDMALNSAITSVVGSMFGGGGATAGFLTSMFGGFRAGGGPVEAGKGYIVGEKGPEPFFPKVDGTILPNKALNGGGGSVDVRVYLNDELLDARIDSRAGRVSAAVVSNGIAGYDRVMPSRSADAQRRFG